ncbi:hypothetical protein [Sphingomonas nostoxanthinifaciens]|uniref:hypothetical protein n=1 Tax=Sphingomonas nostoxanthinifaciens TaxID=2872652 RepID=UPI001CC1D85F|nr:hypothetical protein [Sphingomonas nostoxanthinifaciens]UAK24004.1 hypothetical protein K8P63_16860 [Sphingomonas nostoxanthinifaciens]
MDSSSDLAVEGHGFVATVREAQHHHATAWRSLVPDAATVNVAFEAAEEEAYAGLAAAKALLREHICRTYGVSPRELCRLAAL